MRTTIEKFTPDRALGILSTQTFTNRMLRATVVKAYREQMDEGHFGFTDSMICFDDDGNLLNGWHRMTAASLSKNGFESLVCYGMPTKSVRNMDAQARRSAGDRMMHDLGRRVSDQETAIVRMIASAKTAHTVPNILKLESCILHYERSISTVMSFKNFHDCLAPVQAALVVAIDNNVISESRAKTFFSHMILPDSTGDSAAALLRNAIISDKSFGRGSSERIRLMKIAYKAIIYYAEGRELHVLRRGLDSVDLGIKWEQGESSLESLTTKDAQA